MKLHVARDVRIDSDGKNTWWAKCSCGWVSVKHPPYDINNVANACECADHHKRQIQQVDKLCSPPCRMCGT